jgi:magnesium transporter
MAPGLVDSILTKAVPTALPSATAYEVEGLLRKEAKRFKTINYIYLINKSKKLVGVISIQELLHLKASATLGSLPQRDLVTISEGTKQIEAAELALLHNIKAVPVVSKEGKLIGVVSSDMIIKILSGEHTKSVLKYAGVHHKTTHDGSVLLSDSPIYHVRMRLPWLILGLVGGVAAAGVIGFFEEILADELILAAFIPAIVYMADAVGTQTEMLFVRALSIQKDLNIKSYILRESVVNAILGLVLGLIIFGISLVWINSLLVSSILGVSIFTTVLFTTMVAIFLPWLFYIRGQDPAVASGPLATVICDISSLGIYLVVASLFLS